MTTHTGIALHITVTPNDSESIQMAYSKGMISFETMVQKLNDLRFWCDGCGKYYHKDDYGKSFVDGPTYCQWCVDRSE